MYERHTFFYFFTNTQIYSFISLLNCRNIEIYIDSKLNTPILKILTEAHYG